MCPGTATKLLCPHYLIHWGPGPRCPQRCALPTRRAFLACTCASCDAGFRTRQASARAAAVLLRESASAGREGVRLCGVLAEQMVAVGRAARGEGTREGRLGGARERGRRRRVDPAVGCRWPGAYEEWVAGNLGRVVDWDALLNG